MGTTTTSVRRSTRRELLGRSGAVALGGALAGTLPGGLAEVLAQTELPPSHLRKCISLAGHGSLLVPNGDPNDYRLFGNREYFRSSGTSWVKFWVSWAHLQEAFRPRSRAESWAQLGSAPGGEAALRRLDRQVRAANEDGVGVLITLNSYPTWSSEAHLADSGRGRKPLDAKLPADLTADGPWAWFVAYMCARYRAGVAPSPFGPRESLLSAGPGGFDAFAGNPDGAHADAIEICNEPNQIVWPQPGLPQRVAQMIGSAVAVSDAVGGPPILAPGTSDTEAVGKEDRVNWRQFTEEVLAALAGRRFGERFGWSHHNYNDTADELPATSTRAAEVLRLVRASGVGDGRLWLTESGVNLYPKQDEPATRAEQARKIEHNYTEMAALGGVHMWTQHVINDVTYNNFKSGLRDDFQTVPLGPGPPRPAHATWAALPAARGV